MHEHTHRYFHPIVNNSHTHSHTNRNSQCVNASVQVCDSGLPLPVSLYICPHRLSVSPPL